MQIDCGFAEQKLMSYTCSDFLIFFSAAKQVMVTRHSWFQTVFSWR